MLPRHQVLRLRLSVGVKQTALPLSSHFSNVVEAQSKFSFRVGRLFAIREDERVSSVRESFAQVRASPSLPPYLSSQSQIKEQISRLPRLSLATRSPRNCGQLTAWSEIEMGVVVMDWMDGCLCGRLF